MSVRPPAGGTPRRLITAREVAEMLGVSRWRVHQLVADGLLRPVQLKRRGWLRFRAEDVERLIAGEAS